MGIFPDFKSSLRCYKVLLATSRTHLFIFGMYVKALIMSTGSCKLYLGLIINHNKPILNVAS